MATDVSTSFPDLVLPAGATITVTMDDPLAVVTKLNVFGPSGPITLEPDLPAPPPMFTYRASAA